MASAASAPVFERLAGIRGLAECGRFKAWFLDQFGVLHDGKKPYPGAILTLEKLARNGAKMVIISNSSRRSCVTMEKLSSLGFDTSCFLAAITSGELTHQYLQKRDDPWFAALGRRCIHLTWGNRGAISLEGLGLQVVSNVDDAEFILAHGTEALGLPSGDPLSKSLEELEQVLMLGLEKRLPMVVANPDFVTVEARDLRVMPGTLAAKYESLGGVVKWMGKPDKVIYTSAMSLAGIDAHECIIVETFTPATMTSKGQIHQGLHLHSSLEGFMRLNLVSINLEKLPETMPSTRCVASIAPIPLMFCLHLHGRKTPGTVSTLESDSEGNKNHLFYERE